jgi:hypothetical protein
MPPRTRISFHLSHLGDEAPQPSTTQNQPTSYHRRPRARSLRRYPRNQTPTPNKQRFHHGTSSTQTNGGTLHQSPSRVPLPIQVIQENTELEQIQLKDWEDEASQDEAAEEAELARVQQEIERLHQE